MSKKFLDLAGLTKFLEMLNKKYATKNEVSSITNELLADSEPATQKDGDYWISEY